MNKWVTGSSIAVLALCGFSLMAKPPVGWFAAGSKPADYDISTDLAAAVHGSAECAIEIYRTGD